VADFIVTDHGSTSGVTNNPNTDISIGSLVVVFVQERTTTGNYGTIADTNGNAWTRANVGHPNNAIAQGSASIWYCLKTTQLITVANSVTYTPVTSTVAMVSMISATYAVGSVCSLDINQTPQFGTSNPAIQSGTLNFPNELVVAAIATTPMGSSDTFTQVPGWSNGPDHQYYNIGGQAGATGVCGGNIQVTGTASAIYNPTMTFSRTWVAMMLSFYATRASQTFQRPISFSNGQVGGINKQSGKKIIL
jgi:hypothetical protein